MKRNLAARVVLLILILGLPLVAFAQDECKSPNGKRNLTDYLEERICVNLMGRVDQTDPTKQTAPPAAAPNSTSLVERSSAPDLLGFGLDFLKLSDTGGEKKSATPKTLTFSAYALKMMFTHEDALDPEIYNENAKWRRLSFTAGYDVPEKTTQRDPVVGIKWLAINGRDLAKAKNQKELKTIQNALDHSTVGFSVINAKTSKYIRSLMTVRDKLPDGLAKTDLAPTDPTLFEKKVGNPDVFENILSSLSGDEKDNIDAIVATRISDFATLDAATEEAVNKIRSRAQLALAFNTIQRRSGRPDEYSGVLTFDKGMGNNSITFNGSFILTKTPGGKDSRGGQFAAAIHIPLQAPKVLGYTDPLLLSIEANGKSMTGATPMYVAQAKLTIPIAFLPGMEIPISVSVANRTEFVKEKDVRGKFGFTFDVSKAWKAFRDSFMPRE